MTTTALAPATELPAPAEPVVEVDGLVKRYGDAEVVGGISFSVRRGELFGLLGTNGAGKTTTVEILQGLRRADSGRVRVLGLDPAAAGDQVRRCIGAQLQSAALPERMRVASAVAVRSAPSDTASLTDELVEEWQLGDILRRPFAASSGGERQRLFVALALIGRPELVFLDELTQNLDPMARRRTWDVVRHVRDSGATVVLVTHDVEEAERLCDRIVVMDHGRVVADGTPAAIVDELGGSANGPLHRHRARRSQPAHTPGRDGRAPPRARGAGGGYGPRARSRRRPPRHRRPARPRSSHRTTVARGPLRRPHRKDLAMTTPNVVPFRRHHSLHTISLLTTMELRLLRREPGVLVALIGFPAVTVLVIAGVFGSTPDPDFGGVIPSEHYVVGYLGVVLAAMGLITLPAMIAERRERGVLRRYTSSGVGGGVLVGSHAAVGAIVGTAASALVLLVGGLVYGVPAPAAPSPRWPGSSPA